MLKAFKNHLSLLAIENGAVFALKIKKKIGSKKANVYVGKALNLVMIMPDLIAKVSDLSEQPGIPRRLKPLHGFLLTYLYHPVDFVSDDMGGLFGYLDDAYFVGRVYQKIRDHKNAPEMAEDLARELPETLRMVREILPKESRKIDQLIHELEDGKKDLFDKLMKKGESS